jgi:hypothetical protein
LQFFTRCLGEIVAYSDFDELRYLSGFHQEIPYVSEVLTDSILFGVGHGIGNFWKYRNLGDVQEAINSLQTPRNPLEAKSVGDQLLLLIGLRFRGGWDRWGRLVVDIKPEELETVGGYFYGIAAEDSPTAEERDTLAAMSLNFATWTNVLAQIPCHEQLSRLN